jgi:hypothetical protein
VPETRQQGFYISYAAAGIIIPVLSILVGLAFSDHGAIARLDDKLEYLNGRVVDGTVVARLVDHDANIVERIKIVDDRLKSLETFAGASTNDRASLHFEINSLREYLKYQGKTPPEPPQHGELGHQ